MRKGGEEGAVGEATHVRTFTVVDKDCWRGVDGFRKGKDGSFKNTISGHFGIFFVRCACSGGWNREGRGSGGLGCERGEMCEGDRDGGGFCIWSNE